MNAPARKTAEAEVRRLRTILWNIAAAAGVDRGTAKTPPPPGVMTPDVPEVALAAVTQLGDDYADCTGSQYRGFDVAALSADAQDAAACTCGWPITWVNHLGGWVHIFSDQLAPTARHSCEPASGYYRPASPARQARVRVHARTPGGDDVSRMVQWVSDRMATGGPSATSEEENRTLVGMTDAELASVIPTTYRYNINDYIIATPGITYSTGGNIIPVVGESPEDDA